MEANLASCEVIWIHNLLKGLFGHEMKPIMIHSHNQSCIKLSENLVFHDRSKNIEIIYHFIRDRVLKGEVKISYIPIDEQLAYIFTKPLVKGKFLFFRDKLRVVENTFLAKREC
jgi:hypothetical protein